MLGAAEVRARGGDENGRGLLRRIWAGRFLGATGRVGIGLRGGVGQVYAFWLIVRLPIFTGHKPCTMNDRPLLIGTTSVRESEAVLDVLRRYTDTERYGLHLESVQMLNAKPDKV